MEQEKKQHFNLDKDYPFSRRTELYRNLGSTCSKVYLIHSISSHYNENTFSPKKTGMLRPNVVLAGYAVKTQVDDEARFDDFEVDENTPAHL